MKLKSLYLSPGTHDIVFENGSFRFTKDGEITLQKIKTKLLFYSGDFFLNPELGVDYLKNVFDKNVSDETIKNLFISLLSQIPEIKLNGEILDIQVIRNDNEKISITFKVKDSNGEILEGNI